MYMDQNLPKTTLIPIDNPFVDPRGVIQNLLHRPVGSVVHITSYAESTRASHWHRTDWHYCYVLSGHIDYYEREVDSINRPRYTSICQGELFFTPPKMEHEMYFPVRTSFLTLANLHREPANYEADLVRLPRKLRDIYLEAVRVGDDP